MRASVLLRPVAASALLLAAACGGGNQSADAGNDLTNEQFAEYDNESLDEDELPGDIDLVALPAPPAGVPAAETAPLAQAAAIAEEIDDDDRVERVPYEGGWAWRRDGRILRTASRDGRRIAWFRPGETTPFLVQRGDETFAYRGGQPERAFDRRGRPGAVSPQRREEARRLAEDSRRDRDRAERAPRRPDAERDRPRRDRTDRNENRADDGRTENRTGTARPDRDGQGNRLGGDDRRGERDRDRRREERRQRGDDSTNRMTGNRQ